MFVIFFTIYESKTGTYLMNIKVHKLDFMQRICSAKVKMGIIKRD